MLSQIKSCTVAPPTQCNHATINPANATEHETNIATIELKALAQRILTRNSATRNATRNATNDATIQLSTKATVCNTKSCTVVLPKGDNYATQKKVILRKLIAQLILVCGGGESEWMETAADDLDE